MLFVCVLLAALALSVNARKCGRHFPSPDSELSCALNPLPEQVRSAFELLLFVVVGFVYNFVVCLFNFQSNSLNFQSSAILHRFEFCFFCFLFFFFFFLLVCAANFCVVFVLFLCLISVFILKNIRICFQYYRTSSGKTLFEIWPLLSRWNRLCAWHGRKCATHSWRLWVRDPQFLCYFILLKIHFIKKMQTAERRLQNVQRRAWVARAVRGRAIFVPTTKRVRCVRDWSARWQQQLAQCLYRRERLRSHWRVRSYFV